MTIWFADTDHGVTGEVGTKTERLLIVLEKCEFSCSGNVCPVCHMSEPVGHLGSCELVWAFRALRGELDRRWKKYLSQQG